MTWNETENLRYLAQSRKTPPGDLVRLAGSQDEMVLYFLSHNPNTPKEALEILIGYYCEHDYYTSMRRIRDHPNAPLYLRQYIDAEFYLKKTSLFYLNMNRYE